jgi:hypothetical protein
MAVNYQVLSGELITENSELKDQLSHALQELEDVYHLVELTPNNMKLGKMVRQYYYENTEEMESDNPIVEEEPIYVYESPDEGKTLYRREIGETTRERTNESEQMSLFGEDDTEL